MEQNCSLNFTHLIFLEQVEEQRAPLADPWEPVKPHESTAIVKKRSKGRTSKPPAPNIVLTRTSTKSRRKAEEERPQSTSTIGQFVAEVMAIKSKAPAVKQVKIFVQFLPLMVQTNIWLMPIFYFVEYRTLLRCLKSKHSQHMDTQDNFRILDQQRKYIETQDKTFMMVLD